jgi:UDP-3-O-[3-hydroxymyristoyl] N-acetylglucosamine deacetylase
VLGRVVADRAGHAMHTALVSRVLRDRSMWEEVTLPQIAEEPVIPRRAEAAAGSSLH